MADCSWMLNSNAWRDAVIDELANCCMDAPVTESPASIIRRIIDWNIIVATDKSVNGGYRLTRLPWYERLWIWSREQWWRFQSWRDGCEF